MHPNFGLAVKSSLRTFYHPTRRTVKSEVECRAGNFSYAVGIFFQQLVDSLGVPPESFLMRYVLVTVKLKMIIDYSQSLSAVTNVI